MRIYGLYNNEESRVCINRIFVLTQSLYCLLRLYKLGFYHYLIALPINNHDIHPLL